MWEKVMLLPLLGFIYWQIHFKRTNFLKNDKAEIEKKIGNLGWQVQTQEIKKKTMTLHFI